MSGSVGTAATSRQVVTGYRKVVVRQGDSLQSIAARELGDATLWTSLVALNNLLPPYILDSLSQLEDAPAGRVLLVGQSIKIPAPGRTLSGVLDVTDLYGTDLDLSDGQLHANAAGDLLLISGAPNLTQAINHRLDTHCGELLFHPAYGSQIYELRGEPAGPATNQLAAGYTERAIRADTRIVGVQNVSATVIGDVTSAKATAIATDGKPLPVGGS